MKKKPLPFTTSNISLLALIIIQHLVDATTDNQPILLIVSYSGFHPDNFNQHLTPVMNKLRHDETSADYLQSVFPTKTYPNHYTIATGLYPGTHGVLSNSLYDRYLQRNILDEPDLFHYNTEIRPLWLLNELAGGHSGCMMWPGTKYSYFNRSCTFMIPQNTNRSLSWTVRVDTVMSWLTNRDSPANLIFLFIEEPDHIAHQYSTESKRYRNTISRLDDITTYIHGQLNAANLTDRVNVVHLSDHGMANVRTSNLIDITQWLDNGTYEIYQRSPILQIIPTDNDYALDIIKRLEKGAAENGHFHVYGLWNYPNRWHLENNNRMGPIIVVADVNYAFQDLIDVLGVPADDGIEYGLDGYDINEPVMHGMFFAKGPNIRSNNHIDGPINIVDLYNLFCRILELEPDSNNGTISIVDLVLKTSSKPSAPEHSLELIETTFKPQLIEIQQQASGLTIEETIGVVVGVITLAVGLIAGVALLFYRYQHRQFFGKILRRSNTELRDIVSEEK